MKTKNIIMVEPKAPAEHVFSIFRMPRLGLPILGTLAKRRGHNVRIYFEEATPADSAEIREADLLCISTITPTAPRAYELADRAREAGVPVVMGGAHVTFMADEALQHADWVLRGEAEVSFQHFLDMLDGERNPDEVAGLSYRENGVAVHNPKCETPVSMDEVPIPDFSLLVQKKSGWFHRGIIPIQTSRGCPHECRFCSVTTMFGRRMRYMTKEHVAEELNARRGQGDYVFFYDDNFCASPKHAKELLDHLLTKNVFLPHFTAQVSVRAANDPELVRLMYRAGCRLVCVGFESINPASLDLFKKPQTKDDISESIHRFHEAGIQVHGMFVMGADSDTPETIRATAEFVNRESLQSTQFMMLTPLPGTPVYEDMERDGRLLTKDWSKYDAHHAVFRPARMTPNELMLETTAALGRVYSWKRIIGAAVRGDWYRSGLAMYARGQVKTWYRLNRESLWKTEREQPWLGGLGARSPSPA
jgi:radical SAM superfamily enzyme YgiQ (UPF0313 family)